jgi:hypothetical protein
MSPSAVIRVEHADMPELLPLVMQSLIRSAKEIGYQKLRLDTLPSMATAIAIYGSHGFKEIPRIARTPFPCSVLRARFDIRGSRGEPRSHPKSEAMPEPTPKSPPSPVDVLPDAR